MGIITHELLRSDPEDHTTCGGYCAKGRSDRNQLGHRDMAATDSLRRVMEGSSCKNFSLIFLSQQRCEEELKLGWFRGGGGRFSMSVYIYIP